MDHRIDIKRHDGKVDVVYRDKIAWSREREWSGYEESRETEDALRTSRNGCWCATMPSRPTR
jgi:hypothetical protein